MRRYFCCTLVPILPIWIRRSFCKIDTFPSSFLSHRSTNRFCRIPPLHRFNLSVDLLFNFHPWRASLSASSENIFQKFLLSRVGTARFTSVVADYCDDVLSGFVAVRVLCCFG